MPTAEKVVSAAVDAAAANGWLSGVSAEERIRWASQQFGDALVLTSSFGAQSAVMLSLATRVVPSIPVILIDTGYLFPETYRFADELTSRMRLNVKVYRPELSAAWIEARHGRLWEQGIEGIDAYNRLVKVEPMRRAMRETGARGWLDGRRRVQSSTREALKIVEHQDGRVKICPIADWTDRDVHMYLKEHDLPYHPLWNQGYVSIGDVHTSRPLTADLTPEQTRFFGLKRECGLHESGDGADI
jgi:phosphoadenosine phosphosulfate reductase